MVKKRKNYNRSQYMKKRTKSEKLKLGRNIAIVAVVILGIGFISYYALTNPLSPLYITQPTTPTTTSLTTVTTYSYPDMEDVSNIVEIDIWVPKSSAEFDDTEDIYSLSTNFELLGSTMEAEDISIDLSGYDYIWIEIDPDGTSYFENDFRLLTGGINYALSIYVYHQVSDINFNIVDSTTMNEITVASYQTDGNYTILFDCPHATYTDIHANTADWDVDDDTWEDMTSSEKAYYYDEKNFRCIPKTLDPVNMSTHAKQHPEFALSLDTKFFAFKVSFNASITDSGATAVDITIDDDNEDDVYALISGDTIYFIYDKIVTFDTVQQLGLEMDFGADITMSDIDSVVIEVPGSAYSSGTITLLKKLSDIAA